MTVTEPMLMVVKRPLSIDIDANTPFNQYWITLPQGFLVKAYEASLLENKVRARITIRIPQIPHLLSAPARAFRHARPLEKLAAQTLDWVDE